MFASRGCGGLPHCLRPVYMRRRGSPPGCMRTGGEGMFALHFSCTGVACTGVGLRPGERCVGHMYGAAAVYCGTVRRGYGEPGRCVRGCIVRG